ncbi:unnamed protein product [Hyaloperonospora brassicae]|uniref:RNase H type-1 domain-containing protein n=1 Tax=Hyaloperonospora brassicae TaxID=162125 RepID=A0AAV0TP00_HYABA|nr:unnamed protein product [Hyaloperonospora brassicae]
MYDVDDVNEPKDDYFDENFNDLFGDNYDDTCDGNSDDTFDDNDTDTGNINKDDTTDNDAGNNAAASQIATASKAVAIIFQGTVSQWTISRYLDSTTQTNNTAEYIALVEGLRGAQHHGVRRIKVMSDSALVLERVRGRYSCNNARLRRLRNKASHSPSQL